MAMTNKQKAKVARGAGALLKALVKNAGRKKKNNSTGGNIAGLPTQPKKGCGACG